MHPDTLQLILAAPSLALATYVVVCVIKLFTNNYDGHG